MFVFLLKGVKKVRSAIKVFVIQFNKGRGYIQSTVISQRNVKMAIYSQLSKAKNR